MQAMECSCGVQRHHVRVEVTFPADFFVTFASLEDCLWLLALSGHFRCSDVGVSFRRWRRSAQATGSKLEFLTQFSFEDLPANAWEWEALSQLIDKLDGQLVEILPSTGRWCLVVTTWMRDPCGIPKEYNLEIPKLVGISNTHAFSDDPESLPPP